MHENVEMSLIASVSGIRGTIGGEPGYNLTPLDVVRFSAAYASSVLSKHPQAKIIVGRDGRISGSIVSALVVSTLQSMGIHVIDAGWSTTPSIEMAVPHYHAQGGIILTASHNPKEWNALKLLNEQGEFISAEEGNHIIQAVHKAQFDFAQIDKLGSLSEVSDTIDIHIDQILKLDFIPLQKIKTKKYKVVVDCINSTGAIAIPKLLEKLNCEFSLINAEITGDFAHNPEPLPQHLSSLMERTAQSGDLGIAIDPDVDRLALVDENGNYFGEEYTLVAAADFILSKHKGHTVSNLSSSLALKHLTENKYGCTYSASPVGEVHVVTEMKKHNAVIGGEGNGGIILPDLHYGRDSLVGIVLILSLMAERDITLSELKKTYPVFEMCKDKMEIPSQVAFADIISNLTPHYQNADFITNDGLKLVFPDSWIHIRKSNTEPIIRIYSEAKTLHEAESLISSLKNQLKNL